MLPLTRNHRADTHASVADKVGLAMMHVEDGTYMTAAQKLRQAADELERLAHSERPELRNLNRQVA